MKKKKNTHSKVSKRGHKKSSPHLLEGLPNLIPPKTKRKIGKLMIFIFLIAVVVAAGLLFFGVKVSFLIGEELRINLNPPEKSFVVEAGEDVTFDFEISLDRSYGCDSSCNYVLLDLMTGKNIVQGKQLFTQNNSWKITSLIPAKEQGNKINTYSVQVECNNLKSLLCLTGEVKKHNSALFFVEREFNVEDKNKNEQLRDSLNLSIGEIKIIYSKLLQQKNNLDSLKPFSVEALDISKEINESEKELFAVQNNLKEQITSWEKSELKDSKFIDSIKSSLGKTANNIDHKIDLLTITRNNTINLFDNIVALKPKIIEIYNYSEEVSLELEKLKLLHLQVNSLGGFSESKILSLINLSKNNLLDLTNKFEKEQKSLAIYYLNLLNQTVNTRDVDCSTLVQLKEKLIINNVANFDSLNDFITQNCLFNQSLIQFPDLTITKISSLVPLESIEKVGLSIGEQKKQCCVFEECKEFNSNSNIPILFIHGHALNKANTPEASMEAFARIQNKMLDEGFINAGELNMDHISSDLEKCSFPATIRATYYYNPYFSLGKYTLTVQKSERIENYALRLKEMINFVKEKTGQEKVHLVAHSMGGLVAREYIALFGINDLGKVILINTPNHGIAGKVDQFCSIVGASKECEDLSIGSVFLNKLNSRKLPTGFEIYNLKSKGCLMDNGVEGDGVVTLESANLPGVKNYVIQGKCTDSLQTDLHNQVLNPDLYPQTAELIVKLLQENLAITK